MQTSDVERILSNLSASSSETRSQAAQEVAAATEGREASEAREALASAVPLLVELLGASQGCEAAAQALFHLARSRGLRDLIRREGGLKPLVGLLAAGPQSKLTRYALLALINLVNACAPNREAISCHVRGINRLIRLMGQCSSSPGGEEVEQYAAMLLDRLLLKQDAWVGINKDAVRKEGGLPVLVQLVEHAMERDPEGPTVQALASVLSSLASNHLENREALREAQAIPCLVRMLLLHSDLPAVESATACLASLATNSDINKEAVLKSGAGPLLVRLLSCGPHHPVTRNAATALMVLSYNHALNREALRQAGALPSMVKVLTSAGMSDPVTEKLVWGLSNMAQSNKDNQDCIREEGALPHLIALLDAGEDKAVVRGAACALANLITNNHVNREAMILAGGLAGLVRLAASDTSPAARHATRALRAVTQASDSYRQAISEALINAKGNFSSHNFSSAPLAAVTTVPLSQKESSSLHRHNNSSNTNTRPSSAANSLGIRSALSALTSVKASLSKRFSSSSNLKHELPLRAHKGKGSGSSLGSTPDATPPRSNSFDTIGMMKSVPVTESFSTGPPPLPPHKGPFGTPACLAPPSSKPKQEQRSIKVYCHSGGQLVKGPTEDSPWVYVGGGDTRIVSVKTGSTFHDLVKQLGVFCRAPPSVRYKLPGEEMMVSVYTDQDVQLMFEEWDLWKRWKDWPVARGSSNSKKLHIYVCSSEPNHINHNHNPPQNSAEKTTTTVGIPASEFYGHKQPQPGALTPAELLQLSGSSTLHDSSGDSKYFSFSKSDSIEFRISASGSGVGGGTPMKKPPLSPSKLTHQEMSPSKGGTSRSRRLSGHKIKKSLERSWSPMGRSRSPFSEKLSNLAGKLRRSSKSSRGSGGSNDGTEGGFTELDNANSNANNNHGSNNSGGSGGGGGNNAGPNNGVAYGGIRAPPFVPKSSSRSPTLGRGSSRGSSPGGSSLYSSGDSMSCTTEEEWREMRWRDGGGSHSAVEDSEAHSAAAALRENTELQLIHPNELEGLQRVGAGGYGEVHRGHWKGLEVAIKTIYPKLFVEQEGHNITNRSLSAAHVADFCREAQLISSLQHPNVVRVYGVVQGQRSPAIVTEYVERSLRHILDRQPCALGQRKRLNLALEAARGMEYLHSRRIVHFDFKSSNTLIGIGVNSQMQLKICDFGLAKHKRQTCQSGSSNAICSTLPWTAPEVVRNPEHITEKVDVFSFGVVMWELWTSKYPHAGMDSSSIISGLLFNGMRPVVPCPDDAKYIPPPHPRWKDLMCKCWSEDPVQRPSFDEIARDLEQMCSKRF